MVRVLTSNQRLSLGTLGYAGLADKVVYAVDTVQKLCRSGQGPGLVSWRYPPNRLPTGNRFLLYEFYILSLLPASREAGNYVESRIV